MKKLKVWARAKDFSLKIYKQVLPLLSVEERWNLGQQMRRSSTSIAANIAEEYGRFYYQDNVRFCFNARGSLEETLSHLVLAHEMSYISDKLYADLTLEGEEIEKMLNNYIAFLKKSKRGADEPGASHAMHEEVLSYNVGAPEDLSCFGDTPASA